MYSDPIAVPSVSRYQSNDIRVAQFAGAQLQLDIAMPLTEGRAMPRRPRADPVSRVLVEPFDDTWIKVRISETEAVPERFLARFELREPRLTLVCVIRARKGGRFGTGRPWISEMHISQSDADYPQILTSTLRNIHVDQLIAKALAAMAKPVEIVDGTFFRVLDPNEPPGAKYAGPMVGDKRSGELAERVRRAADIYLAAANAGRPPTATVSETLHVSRSTASRLVAEARRQRLLEPPKGRQP